MNLHRRLLQRGENATAALVAAVALGLASALLAVGQAALLARAISGTFLGVEGVATLAPLLVGLGAVFVARAGIAWGAEVAAQRISATVKASLRREVMAAALAAGSAGGVGRSTASLSLLVTRGLDSLDGYYGRYLPQVALAAIVPVVVVGCLLAVDLVAALTVALTVPLIPVFMMLIGRASAARRDRRWSTLSRLAHRFADVVGGLPTLRAYGRADAQVEILRRTTDAYRSATVETLRVAFLSALALELLSTISVALVAVGIGLRLVEGSLALETGLFALILAPEAYLPLRRLGAEFHASEEGLAAAREAFAVIDAAGDAAERSAGPGTRRHAVPARISSVRVEGLSVEQPGRDVVAPADASVEVRPGEVVAVTGPSGAGKSTLVAVVLGFVQPTVGRVVLEGPGAEAVDLADVDLDEWRDRVAWVPQVPYLLPGTVAENVRLGRPWAFDSEVAAALAAVGLAGWSAARVVGEGGRGLSGGERRRVGVARALLRRSDVLLLDEPTAGLDAPAETAVLDAIRREAKRGAAVLVVAHRPGAIAEADRTISVEWRVATGQPPAGDGHDAGDAGPLPRAPEGLPS